MLKDEKNETLIVKICSEIRKLYHFLKILKVDESGTALSPLPLSPPHFHPIENLCRRFFPSGGGIAVPFQLLVTTSVNFPKTPNGHANKHQFDV